MPNNTQGAKKPDYNSEEYKKHKDYNAMDIDKLDHFTRAYMEAALWSSTDDKGNDLDANYGIEDLSPETVAEMIKDCAVFQRLFHTLLELAYSSEVFIQGERYSASSAGYDFWLTRCGHGVGFWDRGLGVTGDALTEASKGYGNVDLYVGNDGSIYA